LVLNSANVGGAMVLAGLAGMACAVAMERWSDATGKGSST